MKHIAALIMMTGVLAGLQPADAAIPTSWWSNQTSASGVYQPWFETVRLHNSTTGHIEGTVSLPQSGDWTITFRAHTDESVDLPDEYIRVFVDNALVAEIHNTPPGTRYEFDHPVTGNGFSYRFEFYSPSANYGSHMVMDAGYVTSVPDVAGAAPSIAEIWPPNNKMVDITIEGVTDPDGDAVTITIDGITNEETGEEDANGIGTSTAQVRAARNGKGDGRVYEISFTASDGQATSSGTVIVTVPHDQGKGQKKGRSKPVVGSESASWGAIKESVK